MKSGFWHFPAKVLGAVFIIVAVSGLAMAGASSLPIGGANSATTTSGKPVYIESVLPPDKGQASIADDRLSFVLSLPFEAQGSFTGTFDLRNTADTDIMVDVTANNPASVFIDFIDPVYGISGQSGSQHWRLYLKKDGISSIRYLIQVDAASNPGSYEIKVTIVPEESRFNSTPITVGQKMWGGDTPAAASPPAVIYHGWPMFRQNPRHTGRSSYPGLTHGMISTSGASASSPAIAPDGTIYVSLMDWLFAITPVGMPLWFYDTGGNIHSSPAIAPDGTVYIGSYDDNLHAVNPDGSANWTYPTGGNIFSSPVIAPDGTIYFGSYDNKLHAVKPDGSFKWSYMTMGDILSSPAIAPDGTIYFGSSDKRIYALNPDGTHKWHHTTSDVVHSSPAVAPDGTIYIGSADNSLYAINPNGTLKWSYPTGDRIDSSPAIAADGTVYFGSFDGKFYALNPDGSEKWIFPTPEPIYSSPAIDADGTIFFATTDGWLYALNPDGSVNWSDNPGFWFFTSPVIAPDGMVWFVQRAGGPGA